MHLEYFFVILQAVTARQVVTQILYLKFEKGEYHFGYRVVMRRHVGGCGARHTVAEQCHC